MTADAHAVNLFELSKLSPDQRQELMTRTEADLSPFIEPAEAIIEAVRMEGDEAIARFGREFDKAAVEADSLKATSEDFEKAFAVLEPEVTDAIRFAVDNIKTFHEAQRPEPMWWGGNTPRGVRRRAHDADRLRRLLCAARQGRLPFGDDDDHDPSIDR